MLDQICTWSACDDDLTNGEALFQESGTGHGFPGIAQEHNLDSR